MNDLISRQAAISEIVGMTTMGVEELVIAGDKEKYDWIKGLSDSLVKIINLPSAEPERKMGKWVEPTQEGCFRHDAKAYAECSECGKKEFLGWRKNFCPNCGTKMEGDGNDYRGNNT